MVGREGTDPGAGGRLAPALLDASSFGSLQTGAELPAEAEIDRLLPGGLVALCWELPEGSLERRWVEVLDNSGEVWLGRVDEASAHAEVPGRDDLVEFRREHVCDVWFTIALERCGHVRRDARPGTHLVPVSFALEAGSVQTEVLWAQPRADGRYRIESTPFYVADIALGDVVTARPDADGALWAAGVDERSGAATLRVGIDPDAVENPARAVVDLARRVQGPGTEVEICEDTGIVSLSVRREADVQRVLGVLRDLEQAGHAQWETSCAPAWWAGALRPPAERAHPRISAPVMSGGARRPDRAEEERPLAVCLRNRAARAWRAVARGPRWRAR